jgi:hypothetical protein
LPVDISTGIPTPYVAYGDVWDTVPDPLATILINAGGDDSVPWDALLELELLDDTISSKENTNVLDGSIYTRNAFIYAGDLVFDLLTPVADTYNIDVITVFVDPLSHPVTDILPDPTETVPGVIWIEGERIEYKNKVLSAPDTWELRLVRRGTAGTAPTNHFALVPEVDEVNTGPDGETILVDPPVYVANKVWVEENNIMNIVTLGTDVDVDVWNATTLPASPDLTTIQAPNVYTSIVSVPIGGMWYSYTPEAIFLKEAEGKSIP